MSENGTMAVIPMLLWGPECGARHIDVGEFATKVHHTHACQHCGMVWRPAIVATCGVQFLPGFKNELADQQLHADAERYRWLRKQHWSDSQLAVVSNPKENVRLGTYCPSEEQLDAAIDEIMESNSTKNGVSA